MNIFIPYPNQRDSVIALDDKRVVKMTLETAQMLSTALHTNDYLNQEFTQHEILYRATHANHPCTVWARECPENWIWLQEYFTEICNEYQHRYGKVHLSASKLSSAFMDLSVILRARGYSPRYHTEFANCARGGGYDFTGLPVHEAYKEALKHKWLHDTRNPTWTKRQMPLWAQN